MEGTDDEEKGNSKEEDAAEVPSSTVETVINPDPNEENVDDESETNSFDDDENFVHNENIEDNEGAVQLSKSSMDVEKNHGLELVEAVNLNSGQVPSNQEPRHFFTESNEALLGTLKMGDTEFRKFDNPFIDSRISLSSSHGDLRGMLAKVLYNEYNVDIVLIKMLLEKGFVIIYDERLKQHEKMMNLLAALKEPYHLISSGMLMSSKSQGWFWQILLTQECIPPFVFHDGKIHQNLEDLEECLYQRLLYEPIASAHRRNVWKWTRVEPDTSHQDSMAENEFHLVVIGYSCAGFAAAIRARRYRGRVALVDIPRSSSGRNVRVAKKIMHSSALMLERVRLGYKYGFKNTAESKLSWSSLVEEVTDYIHKKTFQRRIALRKKGVKFITAKAKFGSDKKVRLIVNDSMPKMSPPDFSTIKGNYYIISTGTRPKMPSDIIGAKEFCITTDKLFNMNDSPGDTLIIGDSCDGLECAGTLNACEFNVTIISTTGMDELESFDEEFVMKIRQQLESRGVRFIDNCTVLKASADTSNNKHAVRVEGLHGNGEIFAETYNTVVVSSNRVPCSDFIGLTKAGVEVTKSRHIKVNKSERTSERNIYAIGSVAEGRPRSSEVAEKAAVYLVERLFNYSTKKLDYGLVPKIVLTPLEYGSVGITEQMGDELIKLKLPNIRSLSIYENRRDSSGGVIDSDEIHLKVITTNNGDGYNRILGFHILARNVSESLQGVLAVIQKESSIQHFDKVLCSCLERRVLQNLVLKNTLCWSDEIEHPVTIDQLKATSLWDMVCEGSIKRKENVGQEEIYENRIEESKRIYGEKDDTMKEIQNSQESLNLSRNLDAPGEEYDTFSESSSCASLHSAVSVDILKEKAAFMELSFENERIAECVSREIEADTEEEGVLHEGNAHEPKIIKENDEEISEPDRDQPNAPL